jgi:hypothetical protein
MGHSFERISSMRSYGRTSIDYFLQDRIVYRNLQPFDPSLPDLAHFRSQLGLAEKVIPRKNEFDYARAILFLLQACQRQDDPFGKIERLVFVGDTRLLDGTAFVNLCQVSGWPGLAFIGSEDTLPAENQVVELEKKATLFLSNRWSALYEFDHYCSKSGQPIEAETAVVIDMDKTMLGARGRNAGVIDRVRMQSVEQTVGDLLGESFNRTAFQSVYEPLNQPEFHTFTGDNQDYLAYICLILGSGLVIYDDLVRRVRSGDMISFRQFIDEVEIQKKDLPEMLNAIHQDIYACVSAGDPTPFKAFRRNEYLLTVGRFGCLEDGAPVEKMLTEEIVITQEVRTMATEWRQRGALLFGLSDKPDEASIPSPELERQGFLPLHKTVTHSVGSE